VTAKPKRSVAYDGLVDADGVKFSSKNHTALRVLASRIRADHETDNYSRAPLYSLAHEFADLPAYAEHPAWCGMDGFCFTRAEVEERAASLLASGQRQEITCHHRRISGGDVPFVAEGFLRHAAMLLLEVRGCHVGVPEAAGGTMRIVVKPEPKTAEAKLVALRGNVAENEVRKRTTPADCGRLCVRLGVLGMTPKQIADELGKSPSWVQQHTRLVTKCAPDRVLAVHEGRMTLAQALAESSERGEGGSPGPRTGVPVKAMRRALAQIDRRPLPEPPAQIGGAQVYTQAEFVTALALATGVHVSELPESLRDVAKSTVVRDLIAWAKEMPAPDKPPREAKPDDAPKAERPKAKKAPKKAPPRAGKQEQTA